MSRDYDPNTINLMTITTVDADIRLALKVAEVIKLNDLLTEAHRQNEMDDPVAKWAEEAPDMFPIVREVAEMFEPARLYSRDQLAESVRAHYLPQEVFRDEDLLNWMATRVAGAKANNEKDIRVALGALHMIITRLKLRAGSALWSSPNVESLNRIAEELESVLALAGIP